MSTFQAKQIYRSLSPTEFKNYKTVYEVKELPLKPVWKDFWKSYFLPALAEYYAVKFLQKRGILKQDIRGLDPFITETVLDKETVEKQCLETVNLYRIKYGRFPKTILLGEEQYWKLYEEVKVPIQFIANIPNDPQGVTDYFFNNILRVSVVIVPHMEGIVPLKNEYKETNWYTMKPS